MIKLNKGALKISLVYILTGSSWILFSDQLLHLIAADSQTFAIGATCKGWLFIFCTGWILYRLITRLLAKIQEAQLCHEEEIHRQSRLYDVLSQVNRALSKAQTSQELFQEVCDIFVKRSKIKLAWIGKHDADQSAVIPVAGAGESVEYVRGIKVLSDESPEGLGPTGRAVRTGESYVCNDFFADPVTKPWWESAEKAGIRASAVFAFRLESTVYGALNVYAAEKNIFQKKEIALLEEVALAISVGLDHLKEEQQRKLAEEALKKVNEDLEDKVEARTQSLMALNEELLAMNEEMTVMNEKLNKSKEEAEQANLAKSDFLAKMSHEIRTPINAIIGLNYLMQKTKLIGKQQEYVAKTILSAKNLQVIINDILDFSKIEANKVVLENIDFDLYEVLGNISNIISVNVYEKNLKLHFSVDAAAPQFLRGDSFRLQQIILNLANNAVKFTHQGEILIAVRVLEKTSHKAVLEFSVKDTGIGIPSSRQADLFGAFSQMDTSTTRRYGGTGLGLAICRTLVELMGGTIRVESQEGKGSLFAFSLPFGYASQVKVFESSLDSLKFLRVLVVSPNTEIQSNLKSQLEQFGFICSAVNSTSEIKREENRYDLICMDKNLKEMDGIQAATLLRSEVGLKVPIIMLVCDYRDSELQAQEELAAKEVNGIIYYPIGQSQLYNEIIGFFEHVVSGPKRTDESHNRFTMLKGVRVLLVEDNDINQQVAKEIMEDEGIAVDVASNGKEAVELALNKRYDIVLMDVQMPVMDGYEAASRIRELLHTKSLPIIALTADAVKGVSDKVFDAGMDGYITKPIEPLQLLSMIKRWLSKDEWGGAQSLPVADEISSLKNLPGLNLQAGLLRINGKMDKYLELLILFREKQLKGAVEIKAALKADNQELAVRTSHTLKGAAGNIGLEDVFDAAVTLEQLLRQRSSVDTELEKLAKALDAAAHSIDSVLTEYAPQEYSGEVNSDEFNKDVKMLKAMIEMSQVAAIDVFKRIAPELRQLYGPETEELKTALADFDWEHAGELLNSMRSDAGEPSD
ncbi:MAG: response regulator [Pelosinus sp.]|nr:response regulator [Pelosinus sp.]